MPSPAQKRIDGDIHITLLILGWVFLLINLMLAYSFKNILDRQLSMLVGGAFLMQGLFLLLTATYFSHTIKAAKKVTEELELAKIKIETEKAKDEALLNSIGDGVVATDNTGAIIFINKVAEEMLSWTGAVIGEKLGEISLLTNANGEHISIEKHPLHLSLETKKQVVTKDYRFVREGKVDLAVYISATPVILKDEVVGAIEVFRDITKEKEIDQAKSEFVSLASHQLRTPLSTVNWYTEMLLAGDAGKMNAEQKKYLREIYDSNNRMIDLVNTLLNVSRIEMGTFKVKPEPIKISEVIESLLSELSVQTSQHKLKVEKKFGKDVPTINADPSLIRIIIQNLLSNAVKYTPDGGKISAEVMRRPHDVMIEIKDSGYGIPKNQQDKIFNKMFRAENVKDKITDGNGLGLYSTKAIVEQSGGKIWFESEENKGTSFFVTIPLTDPKKKIGKKNLSAF
ncbi:MAG: ATP-binding protein [Candidatus Magasanikbacteria bacterium]